jgi:hypothetical protein
MSKQEVTGSSQVHPSQTHEDAPRDHQFGVDDDNLGAFGWRTYLSILLVLLAFSATLNVVVAAKLPGHGVVDSLVYVDALDKATRGELVRNDSVLDEYTLRLRACEGWAFADLGNPWVDWSGNTGDPEPAQIQCLPGSESRPAPTVEGKGTTAYVHPPTFFFLTAGFARAVQTVFPDADTYYLARLANSLWFALGGWLLVVLATLWGARPWPATAVVAALAVSSSFVNIYGFLSPDVLALPIAALGLVLITLWWRASRHWAWLFPVGVLTVAFKSNLVVIVPLLILFLLTLTFFGHRRSWREFIAPTAALILGAGVTLVIWRGFLADPILYNYAQDPFMVPLAAENIPKYLLNPLDPGRNPSFTTWPHLVQSQWTTVISTALALLIPGAIVAGWLTATKRSILFATAMSGIVAGLFTSLAFSLMGYLQTGLLFPPAIRYAFAALAICILPLLLLAHRRLVWLVCLTLAVGGLLAWVSL